MNEQIDWRIYFGLPVLLFAIPHIFLLTGGYYVFVMPIPREDGLVENATALFFLIASLFAFRLIAKSEVSTLVRAAFIFIAVASLWVCLEEISYGQHYFGYTTPEWFGAHNKNHELNFHNLDNDAPSYALKTGGYLIVSIFGIIIPLVMYFKGRRPAAGTFWDYFLPSVAIIPASLLHLFANAPKAILRGCEVGSAFVDQSRYFAESGEYEEYMLGVWAIMFLLQTSAAIRRANKS